MTEPAEDTFRCPRCGYESRRLDDFARSVLNETLCWRCLGGYVSVDYGAEYD